MRFSSSAPQLTLALDAQGDAYVTGSVISGKAILKSADIDPTNDKLTVEFSGVADSRIWKDPSNEADSHHDGANLLRIAQTLEKPEKPHSHAYEWHFSITVPSKPQSMSEIEKSLSGSVGRFAATDDEFSNTLPFAGTSDHELPPSFKHDYLGYSGRYESSVQYTLKASVNTRRGLATSEKMIALAPSPSDKPNQEPRDTQKTFEIKSNNLNPGHGHSLTGFIHHRPHFNFTATMHTPQTAHMGDKIPLTIRITPDLERSSVKAVPEITVKMFNYEVKASTHVRTSGGYLGDMGSTSESVVFHCMRDPHIVLTENNGYSFDLETHPLGGPSLVPNLSTYNIARSYTTHVRWVLTCAGEEVKFDGSNPIEIHSGKGTAALTARSLMPGYVVPHFP
ncbi:MAG: hypothetical protein M1831_003971 [Alyxoria varia]|nr:MAG: hypothetical protein M1831_003971 [Alyxoria varia]